MLSLVGTRNAKNELTAELTGRFQSFVPAKAEGEHENSVINSVIDQSNCICCLDFQPQQIARQVGYS